MSDVFNLKLLKYLRFYLNTVYCLRICEMDANVIQNAVSTRGHCWLAAWTGDVAICAAEDGLAIGTGGGGWPSAVHCPGL